MKFNVSGKTLYDRLSAVSKVVNSKNTLSILDNFLLSVKDNVLSITGSDQENVVTASLEVFDASEDGAVAVNAKRFLELAKEVSSQPLVIDVDLNTFNVNVEYLSGHFNFIGVNPAEFPQKEEQDTEVTADFSLPASEVRRALEMTLYAVSTEQIRPMMTGVLWDIEESKVTFVSSDTHKLVRYANTSAAPGVKTSFIMPSKPASVIKSLIGKEDMDVHIVADTKGASFEFDGYKISCRFIKGNYPPYNRVIPVDNPFSLTVDRQTFLTGLRRASLLASNHSLVRLDISASEIKITGQDLDYSTLAVDRVSCEYFGNPITIGFNAQFCQEVLSNMTCEMLKLDLSDPARPGVFSPLEQEEDENLVVILMPMQVIE